MSLTLRPSESRGHANHGWLDSYHTFSFGHYYDEAHMGFRDLRVINDDVIKPAAGFPTHGHDNMEIITYVIRGALAHKDSTGGEGIIRRGDVQSMSAGTGVRHSEFNASRDQDVRLIQTWILPRTQQVKPAYAQAHFSDEQKHNTLRPVAAPNGEDGALPIHQDMRLYAGLLDAGASVTHRLKMGRGAWVQVVGGEISLNNQKMKDGDGMAIEDENEIKITAQQDSEFLLFDLA